LSSISAVFINNQNVSLENQNRIKFGHVLYFEDISIPESISPGKTGEITFTIHNKAQDFIKDIIITPHYPSGISSYKESTQNKVAEMISGEEKEIRLKVIISPTAEEGVYTIPLIADYINYVGEKRQENETISLIILSAPELTTDIKTLDIHKKNSLGNIKIKVINNNIGNVKLLSIKLQETKEYEIIGSNIAYVGDLDSDDFSESTFKINLNSKSEEIIFPAILSYKDSMNNAYEEKIELKLKIETAKNLGIKTGNSVIIVAIIIILLAGYIFYRKKRKNLIKEKQASFKSNFKF
jgi:LPXTG-motif cell wall-anchored protein